MGIGTMITTCILLLSQLGAHSQVLSQEGRGRTGIISTGIRSFIRDVTLLTVLRQAARDTKQLPTSIERAVGIAAAYNSSESPDTRRLVNMINIGFHNVDRKTELRLLHNRRDLVFWVRPWYGQWQEIVGICWMDDGSFELFTGHLTPR